MDMISYGERASGVPIPGYQSRENPGAFEPDGPLTAVHHVDNPDTKEEARGRSSIPPRIRSIFIQIQCFLNCLMIWFNENQANPFLQPLYLIK